MLSSILGWCPSFVLLFNTELQRLETQDAHLALKNYFHKIVLFYYSLL